ncbi:MAG TPA: hypothetical protein DIU15_09520 [Deltaproteobacteria bacterium]|nr:hypothetical protein [Deltaproteobacteria bacterium]HCP46270.1 hypothetical protein [Deltaproteobacteria bacterium]
MLVSLVGQPVLVVAELSSEPSGEGPSAAVLEAEVTRSLALVPMRLWPVSADATLGDVLAGPAPGRLLRARSAAETRRLPWLLVRGPDHARIETTRGGEILWTTQLQDVPDPNGQLARRLVAALRGLRSSDASLPGLLDPSEVRLAPLERIDALRQMAAEGSWGPYREQLQRAEATWPADPAIRTHVALLAHLERSLNQTSALSAPLVADSLGVARGMNPDGESELLAVALAAESADNRTVALFARRLLTELYPERLDYRPELADALAEDGNAEAALQVCRVGLAGVERAQVLQLAPGSTPESLPVALPFADLAFSMGWHLAQKGAWELAALNYEDATIVYERMARQRELSDALNNTGVALVELGRPLLAAVALRSAVSIRTTLGASDRTGNSRYNLGRALTDAGRLREGRESYLAAAEDYAAAGAPLDALETHVELLDLAVRLGNRQALERDAEGLMERLSAWQGEGADGERAREMVANVWYQLGHGRLSFEQHQEAIDAFVEAREQWRAMGRRLEEGQALYSLALPHLALMQFGDAHRVLVDALLIAVELADSTSILAIRSQLSQVEDLMRKAGEVVPALPDELERWARPPSAG